MKFEERYESCIFMARVAQYVVGAFEEDDYDHALYDKVDKVIAKLDNNPKAKGFIGPQTPSKIVKKLVGKAKNSKFAFGLLWLKGYYTSNPHVAYQEWCRELTEAKFTEKETAELVRVAKVNNNCYDELGAKAWSMLQNR